MSRNDQIRIQTFLNKRLVTRESPRELGEALAGPLSGYWKCRVGDFRLIARVEDQIITVTVVRIGNRRDIYR